MMFSKKFAAALMMLTQVSQAMPNYREVAPQTTTTVATTTTSGSYPTSAYPSGSLTVPPISPGNPHYEHLKAYYDYIRRVLDIRDVPAPTTTSIQSPKPTEVQEKPKEKPQPQKETPNNGNLPGSNEKFNPRVVLDLTNKLRAQHGKKPLELRSELQQDAYEHTKYMVSIDKLTHDRRPEDDMRKSLERKGLKTGGLAENIAAGALTDKDVYNSWSNSQGHLENMLGDYDYMGVAISGKYSAQTFASKA
jgi:uncharacterized protein YkwD